MFTRRTLLTALVAATALTTAVQAQVKLVRKMPEGKRVQTTTQNVDQKLTIAGMEVPTIAEVKNVEELTYAKPDAEGKVRVAVKDVAMIYKLKAQGMDIADFNSDKPAEAKAAVPQLQSILEGFKAISGKTRTLVYDKDGKLKAIEGVDAILAGVPADARAELEKGYSKEVHEAEAKKDRDRIPDREIKKGDKWQVTEVSNIGAGQTLTYDMFYEYQGTVEKDGRTLDKISIYAANVKYAQADNPNAPLKVLNSDLKIESSTGMMYFDREKGEMVEIMSNIRITGPMTFSINNQQVPGKLDLTLDSQTVVK